MRRARPCSYCTHSLYTDHGHPRMHCQRHQGPRVWQPNQPPRLRQRTDSGGTTEKRKNFAIWQSCTLATLQQFVNGDCHLQTAYNKKIA